MLAPPTNLLGKEKAKNAQTEEKKDDGVSLHYWNTDLACTNMPRSDAAIHQCQGAEPTAQSR